MRILYVVPYVPSLIRVRPFHFIRELSKHHEVTVLATGFKHDVTTAEALRDVCQSAEVVPLELSNSLRSCAAAALAGDPLQAAFCRSPQLTRRVQQLLSLSCFDIVHVEHLRAAHLRTWIPGDVPTVFDAVDCISLLQERTLRSSHSLRQRGLAGLELTRTRRYEGRMLPRFDAVVATSPEDASALRELAPNTNVAVVPNGVDLDYFRPLDGPTDAATIVFSGKMSYHANVSAVLYFVQHVLPLVRQSRPDVRVRIVGSSPPRSILDLARDPNISVTGHVADIRADVGRATVAICPVTVKVGIQNKVLEAMAMGVPVVSNQLGAEGLMAQRGRDFLVGTTPRELADRLCLVLSDRNLRANLAERGRRYVETHHRWSTAVRQLEDSYMIAQANHHARRSSLDPASAPAR